MTKLSPPYAVSTVSVPMPSTSIVASRRSAKDGTFVTETRSTFPFRQSATARMSPPGASNVSSVRGSVMGRMPVSNRTVETHRLLDPDMGGVSSGSMMIQPI